MKRCHLEIFVMFKAANVQSVVEQICSSISGVIKEGGFNFFNKLNLVPERFP